MEIIGYILAAFVGACYGAIKGYEFGVKESARNSELSDAVINIRGELENDRYYFYNVATDLFMFYADTRAEMEQEIDRRFTGKQVICVGDMPDESI